ncbi:histone-lysine N-methyltransferase SMYD3-like [Amblyomma americanum]
MSTVNGCDSLKSCSRCRVAHYCNKLCQASALSEHLPECCYFEDVFPDIPDVTVRLLTRIVHKLQKERMKDCKEMVQGHMRTLEDMESHANEIMNDPVTLPKFHAAWATVKYILGENNVPPLLDGLEIFGRMVINRFCITDNELKPVGQGLYIGASIFDHSCDPDAAYVFEGTRLTVRATRSLSVNSVREIYICYVDKLLLKEDRIAALERQYYFTCNCAFCQKDAREPLYEKWSGLTECVRNLQLELEKAENEGDVERIASRCREILVCQGKELPDNDVAKVEALLLAFQCGARLATYAEAIGYALQAMEVMRTCYGMYSPIYGLHLLHIGRLYNDSGNNVSAENFLQMASSSLAVSHGTTHTTYRELQRLRKLNRRAIPGGCK